MAADPGDVRGYRFLARVHLAGRDFAAAARVVEAWQFVVAWTEERGYRLQAEWPRRELARLRGALAAG